MGRYRRRVRSPTEQLPSPPQRRAVGSALPPAPLRGQGDGRGIGGGYRHGQQQEKKRAAANYSPSGGGKDVPRRLCRRSPPRPTEPPEGAKPRSRSPRATNAGATADAERGGTRARAPPPQRRGEAANGRGQRGTTRNDGAFAPAETNGAQRPEGEADGQRDQPTTSRRPKGRPQRRHSAQRARGETRRGRRRRAAARPKPAGGGMRDKGRRGRLGAARANARSDPPTCRGSDLSVARGRIAPRLGQRGEWGGMEPLPRRVPRKRTREGRTLAPRLHAPHTDLQFCSSVAIAG